MGVVQNQFFRCDQPQAARPLIRLCCQSVALGLCVGPPATDTGAHPPEVPSVGAQATDGGAHPPRVSGVGAPAADLGAHLPEVSGMGTHLGFQLWVLCPLIWVCTNQASGVCWGCLSSVHSPAAEGVRAQ